MSNQSKLRHNNVSRDFLMVGEVGAVLHPLSFLKHSWSSCLKPQSSPTRVGKWLEARVCFTRGSPWDQFLEMGLSWPQPGPCESSVAETPHWKLGWRLDPPGPGASQTPALAAACLAAPEPAGKGGAAETEGGPGTAGQQPWHKQQVAPQWPKKGSRMGGGRQKWVLETRTPGRPFSVSSFINWEYLKSDFCKSGRTAFHWQFGHSVCLSGHFKFDLFIHLILLFINFSIYLWIGINMSTKFKSYKWKNKLPFHPCLVAAPFLTRGTYCSH